MAGNSDDPAWILLLMIGIFGCAAWGIWFFFRPELLEAMRYVRLVEMAPLVPVDANVSACFTWLRQVPREGTLPTDATIYAAAKCFGVAQLRGLTIEEAMKYYTLTPTSLGVVSREILAYWRWVVIACCGGLVYAALFMSKRDSFKTKHTLESFIQTQAKMWPVIAPITGFNPSKHSARIPGAAVPEQLPLFAEALSPEEWLSFQQIPVNGNIPDRERTRQAFAQQLGPRWRGYKELPFYMQALLAAFALKGVQKRDESDDFLGRISRCWTAEKGFVPTPEIAAEVKKILADPAIGGPLMERASKHAYRTTALLGVLKWARFMGGVLAAAQFLWLRGTDRNLWYALNNQGRRSFHMEGAGAMAHFMAEDTAGKALPIPRLETAIVALNQYLAATQPEIPPFGGKNKSRAG